MKGNLVIIQAIRKGITLFKLDNYSWFRNKILEVDPIWDPAVIKSGRSSTKILKKVGDVSSASSTAGLITFLYTFSIWLRYTCLRIKCRPNSSLMYRILSSTLLNQLNAASFIYFIPQIGAFYLHHQLWMNSLVHLILISTEESMHRKF